MRAVHVVCILTAAGHPEVVDPALHRIAAGVIGRPVVWKRRAGVHALAEVVVKLIHIRAVEHRQVAIVLAPASAEVTARWPRVGAM